MLQGRLTYGGALSGRDQNAATKTITGLLKLIHPSPEDPGADKLSGTDVWAMMQENHFSVPVAFFAFATCFALKILSNLQLSILPLDNAPAEQLLKKRHGRGIGLRRQPCLKGCLCLLYRR